MKNNNDNNTKHIELCTKQDNLREDYQIVKENILNEAKLDPDMTTIEYRLILIAMSKISPTSKQLNTISFTSNDFCKILGLVNRGMYSHIKKCGKKLQSRVICVEDKDQKKWFTISWFNKITYENGLINLKFHEDLEKYILKITKEHGYTKYLLSNVLKLKSKHSMRTYELLKQFEKIGTRTFDLTDFKERIGILAKKYPRMNDFRRRILNEVIKEINICTDITIAVEEIREGKKTTKLKFYIQSKNNFNRDGNFKIVTKDKIILRIQNLIHMQTGFIFEAKHMNHIHRNILLELLENFEHNQYNKVLIYNPENFFINEIKTILDKYDMEMLKKKFKDY